MKTTIYITKKLVIAFLFLLIGGYCTLYGIFALYRESRCIPIETLTKDNCHKGAYVSGVIDSCVTINVEGKNLGESVSYITRGGTYHGYTIPISDSHYIRLMLLNEDTVDALKKVIAGESKGVYVEGQIVKEMVEANYPWYEKSDQIKNPQEEILGTYVIRQISFDKRHKLFGFGVGMLIATIFVIWKGKIIPDAFYVERVESLSAESDRL